MGQVEEIFQINNNTMTTEELKEYNALSDYEKVLYDNLKAMHPEYDHDKCITFAKISMGSIIEDERPIDRLKQKIKDFFK